MVDLPADLAFWEAEKHAREAPRSGPTLAVSKTGPTHSGGKDAVNAVTQDHEKAR